jgi:hypothetical protein
MQSKKTQIKYTVSCPLALEATSLVTGGIGYFMTDSMCG